MIEDLLETRFPKDESVIIAIRDINEIRSLQKMFGGWNPNMEECMEQPCKVIKIDKEKGKITIKAPSGHYYIINPKLLSQYEKDKSYLPDGVAPRAFPKVFSNETTIEQEYTVYDDYEYPDNVDDDDDPIDELRKGSRVRIHHDLEKVKELQLNHGGWVPSMQTHLGQQGTVEVILQNGDVKIKISGQTFQYNRELLMLVDPSENTQIQSYKIGEKVTVNKDPKTVHELQKGHGQWVDSLRLVLGEKGKIKHILPDGDLRIKVFGMEVTLNPNCVSKCPNASNEDDENDDDENDDDENNDDENDDKADNDKPVPEMLKMLNQMAKLFGDPLDESETDSPDGLKTEKREKRKDFLNAVRNGNMAEVKKFLDPIDTSLKLESSNAVHIAAKEGYEDILSLLLEKDFLFTLADKDKSTPLHLAVSNDRFNICDILLRKKANISNSVDSNNMTPLMLAASLGFVNILNLLIKDEKTDINESNEGDEGNTVLHVAVKSKQPESVRTLLNAGAQMSQTNQQELTPLQIAQNMNLKEIINIFEEKEQSYKHTEAE